MGGLLCLQKRGRTGKISSLAVIALALLFVAIISVIVTINLSSEIEFIRNNSGLVIAGELALFGIILVELLGQIVISDFEKAENKQRGFVVRSILRAVLYLVLTASVFLVLASNSALAVGIGSITGIVIGFTGQNLFGNLMAGTVLSLTQVIRIGEEITVGGFSGKVIEMGSIYSILDTRGLHDNGTEHHHVIERCQAAEKEIT